MNTTDLKTSKSKKQQRPASFIEGDNVVPQGGEVQNDEPVEEKSNTVNKQSKNKNDECEENKNMPSGTPQKSAKMIRHLRSSL